VAHASGRGRSGDLVDVARLALADAWRGDELRGGLTALRAELDHRVARCLHELRERFASGAREGPAAFVAEFAASLGDESLEEIRELVATVTYDVLGAGLIDP